MQKIQVDSVSDVKTNQYGPSSKIKCGADFYYVNEDATPLVGKTLEVEVTEKTTARGGKYKVAKVVKVLDGAVVGGSAGHGNGHIPWADYRLMASEAHKLATELEPDDLAQAAEGETAPAIAVDRSTARAAILNTIMIAFSNGKLALPDDDMPF